MIDTERSTVPATQAINSLTERAAQIPHPHSSSAMTTLPDALDRPVSVLALIEAGRRGPSLLRIDDLLALGQRAEVSADLIRRVLAQSRFAEGPLPGVVALLHALLPPAHIDLTRPPSVMRIACTQNPAVILHELYGEAVAWLPQTPRDFVSIRAIVAHVEAGGHLRGVLLGRYGLLTWGADSAACAGNTRDLIALADTYGETVPSFTVTPPLESQQEPLASLLPALRGSLGGVLAVSAVGADFPYDLLQHAPEAVSLEVTAEGQMPIPVPLSPAMAIPSLSVIVTQGEDCATAQRRLEGYLQMASVAAGAESLGGYVAPESPVTTEEAQPDIHPDSRLQELAGKVAIVSGAASGIGRAIAYRLAKDGAHVVVADINREGGTQTADAICAQYGEGRARFVATDVTDEAAVIACFRETVLAYGGVDILVNNAGIAVAGPIEETSMSMWRRAIDILVTGYFLMAREAVKVMKTQGRGGAMVFVGSKNSIAPSKGTSAYAAAKAAEIQMARVLAEELGEQGIRVNSVLPDAVIQGSSIWQGGYGDARLRQYGLDSAEDLADYYRQRNALKVDILPEDVAEAVVFLAGPRSSKTTGAVLSVDGGLAIAYVR